MNYLQKKTHISWNRRKEVSSQTASKKNRGRTGGSWKLLLPNLRCLSELLQRSFFQKKISQTQSLIEERQNCTIVKQTNKKKNKKKAETTSSSCEVRNASDAFQLSAATKWTEMVCTADLLFCQLLRNTFLNTFRKLSHYQLRVPFVFFVAFSKLGFIFMNALCLEKKNQIPKNTLAT